MIPTIQAVTITVSNLARSKRFYETVIGFEPDANYAPTKWQSYTSDGRAYFCITEDGDYKRVESKNIINFDIANVEELWARVKGKCVIEAKLEMTPWGTYKFIIMDPDGNRLAFCQKK